MFLSISTTNRFLSDGFVRFDPPSFFSFSVPFLNVRRINVTISEWVIGFQSCGLWLDCMYMYILYTIQVYGGGGEWAMSSHLPLNFTSPFFSSISFIFYVYLQPRYGRHLVSLHLSPSLAKCPYLLLIALSRRTCSCDLWPSPFLVLDFFNLIT